MLDFLQRQVDAWIEEPSASIVKEMREATGWGMMECKSYLEKARIMRQLDEADTVEKLRDLMKDMIGRSNWVLR